MYDAKVERIGASRTAADHAARREGHHAASVLDQQWRDHLGAMDYLRQGIHLRGYAQKDYRYEYKREAFELFAAMLERIKFDTVTILATLDVQVKTPEQIEREEEARRARLNRALQMQHAEAASLSQLRCGGRRTAGAAQPSAPGARQAPPPQALPQARAAARCAPRRRSAATSLPVRQRQEVQELPRRARGSRVKGQPLPGKGQAQLAKP